MPTFEYQAKTSDGQIASGVIFGITLDGAARDLASKGLEIVKIGVASNPNDPLAQPSIPAPPAQPVAQPSAQPAEHAMADRVAAAKAYQAFLPSPDQVAPSTEERSYMETSVWGPLVGKVPLKELAFFFRQLSTMLHAGVPIVQSVTTLATQAQSQKLGVILREMSGHINAGRKMSEGMQRYPEVFNPVMLSLIRAGEQAGFLDEALGVVADYIDREIELRNLYRRLTFMPKLEIGASILIVIAANMIISSMGKQGGLWSPLTEPLTWVFLGPLIVVTFLFFRVGLANPRIRHNWDVVVSKTPYIGTTVKQMSMAKFGRAFGALHRGGVPLSKSLTLSADACGNEYLRSKMYTARGRMEEGVGVTETLRDTQAFSPIVIDMVATGETTGNLDQMLTKMSEFYEQEATTRATQTAQVVGVVLFLCVAIYIGYVVINFWSGYGAGVSSAG
ncbi:MAG: type II secretion system F family protein [Fimbriimonas sp.]|nr:type II secretion system F family protein [Fimbriimonas sp.]